MKFLYTLISFFSFLNFECSSTKHVHTEDCRHWRVIYRPDGKIQDSLPYTRDSLIFNGVSKHFLEDGSTVVNNIKNGEFEGDEVWYYPSGEIYAINNFHKDHLNGYGIILFRNGQLKTVDSFYFDRKIGNSWEFDSNGVEVKKGSSNLEIVQKSVLKRQFDPR